MILKSLGSLSFKSDDKFLLSSNLIKPSLVLSNPAIDLRIVDFPLPDSPTRAIVSPFLILILISLTVGLSSVILLKIWSKSFCLA